MASMPGIVIKIAADARDALGDLRKVDRALGQTATSSSKANAVMAKGAKIAGAALAGAAVAAGALAVKLGVDGVNAAIDDQAAQKKLAQSLKNSGFGAYTDQIEANIDAMMQATGVADDELRPAYAQLLGVTKDMAQTEALLAAAMDLAAAKGIPLEDAVKAVAKAASGSATALSRIAPELGKIDTKGDAAAATLAAVNRQFGGQQAAKMNTIRGRLDAVSTAFGELQESFGTGFIGDADAATGSLTDMTQMMYDRRDEVEAFGAALNTIVTNLGLLTGAAASAKEALDSLPLLDQLTTFGNIAGGTPLGQVGQAWTAIQAAAAFANAPRQLSAGGASTQVFTPSVDYNPVLWQQQANVAAARANGRTAQKQARTGSRP